MGDKVDIAAFPKLIDFCTAMAARTSAIADKAVGSLYSWAKPSSGYQHKAERSEAMTARDGGFWAPKNLGSAVSLWWP